jgi:hypothetical protein
MRVMVDANKLLALKAFQIGAWQEVCGEISSVGCDQDKIGLSFPPNFMHQS